MLFGHLLPGAKMASNAVVIRKEMAVTHADFFRSIPNAIDQETQTVSGTTMRLESEAGTWTIELGPEGKRQIALLAVPATMVTLTFEEYTDAERENALERFDRAFQRGGG